MSTLANGAAAAAASAASVNPVAEADEENLKIGQENEDTITTSCSAWSDTRCGRSSGRTDKRTLRPGTAAILTRPQVDATR